MIDIVWPPRALGNMRDARDYIAADNEVAADRTYMSFNRLPKAFIDSPEG